MSNQSNKIVFGGASLGQPQQRPQLAGQEAEEKIFSILKSQSVDDIDSAQIYGDSEAVLGRHNALNSFTVSTKWAGGWSGKPWATQETILKTYKESLERLAVKDKPLDIFYIHSPDANVPIEETLKGVDEAYRSGGFERFGLSNYSPDQVREVVKAAEKNGWVKPSVYQGSYSAVSRKPEDELIPLLREHKIAFYAYSPISGGFLVRNLNWSEMYADFDRRRTESLWNREKDGFRTRLLEGSTRSCIIKKTSWDCWMIGRRLQRRRA